MSAEASLGAARSAAEVLADALVSLFAARLMQPEPEVVGRACALLGLTAEDLRHAGSRAERGWALGDPHGLTVGPPSPSPPPRPPCEHCSSPIPAHAADRASRPRRFCGRDCQLAAYRSTGAYTAAATAARKAAKNPAEGRRRCSICRRVRPLADFALKDRTRGTYKSACRDCLRRHQAERYLSVDKVRVLNAARLTLIVGPDDGTGLACMDCGLPLVMGEEVYGDASLRHTTCPIPPPPRP